MENEIMNEVTNEAIEQINEAIVETVTVEGKIPLYKKALLFLGGAVTGGAVSGAVVHRKNKKARKLSEERIASLEQKVADLVAAQEAQTSDNQETVEEPD